MIVKDIIELRKPNYKASLEESKEIIKQLEKELSVSGGVGLAAPQISIHKQVVIIRSEDKIDLVNPIILEKQNGFVFKDEGCLSFPGKRANTFRYKEIFVKDDLHPEGFIAVGMTAIVIAHETDHLAGKLLPDNDIGKIGRNDPCPCGALKDGKAIKFKNCHGRN
jgi:peptide deformylase